MSEQQLNEPQPVNIQYNADKLEGLRQTIVDSHNDRYDPRRTRTIEGMAMLTRIDDTLKQRAEDRPNMPFNFTDSLSQDQNLLLNERLAGTNDPSSVVERTRDALFDIQSNQRSERNRLILDVARLDKADKSSGARMMRLRLADANDREYDLFLQQQGFQMAIGILSVDRPGQDQGQVLKTISERLSQLPDKETFAQQVQTPAKDLVLALVVTKEPLSQESLMHFADIDQNSLTLEAQAAVDQLLSSDLVQMTHNDRLGIDQYALAKED